MQAELHRWAAADPGRRFDDLFNLVHDPATPTIAYTRVAGNGGARTPGVDGPTAAVSRRTSSPSPTGSGRCGGRTTLSRDPALRHQWLPLGAGRRHRGVLRLHLPPGPDGPGAGQGQGQARARAGQGFPERRGPHRGRPDEGDLGRHAAERDPVPAAGPTSPWARHSGVCLGDSFRSGCNRCRRLYRPYSSALLRLNTILSVINPHVVMDRLVGVAECQSMGSSNPGC
jgi:hypothetical protein